MYNIELIKSRNALFLDTSYRLHGLLSNSNVMNNLYEIRIELSRLFGGLGIHLLIAEKIFYPRLSKIPSPVAFHAIDNLHEQVVELAHLSTMHRRKWKSIAEIEEKTEEFVRETKSFLIVLNKHLDTEREKIYPLIEAA